MYKSLKGDLGAVWYQMMQNTVLARNVLAVASQQILDTKTCIYHMERYITTLYSILEKILHENEELNA